MTCRGNRDAGFTLVEMVISVLVLGIITVPLVSAFIIGIGTTAQSNATTLSSAEDQGLSAFFTNDVASAYRASTASNCGSGGTTVVQLELGKTGSGASPYYVTYRAAEDSTAEATQPLTPIYALTRYTCNESGTTIGALRLASQMTEVPSLACAGLNVAGCDGTPRSPTLISMTISEYGRTQSDATYDFTISGTRRVTA